MADIVELQTAAREALLAASTTAELDAARVAHLGRSAPLITLLGSVGSLPPDERAVVGKEGNIARGQLEKLAAGRAKELGARELRDQLAADRTDVTLPGTALPLGTLHPLVQTMREIEDVFLAMGYDVATGPEVESEFTNFTALNTPEGHPARGESDTYYVDAPAHPEHGQLLLRTQTSPVQIRTMQTQAPPLYVVSPGRVYRREDIDATHGHIFHQAEGLAVDEGLTLADLKGTVRELLRRLFGADREIRLRSHFFPFTEPSVEADLSCFVCDGSGRVREHGSERRCPTCKGAGWIEMMGAGMVDPNVFRHVGYDPDRVTGFAFGLGIDRVAMMRYGIPDLRMLFENNLRLLRQFTAR